MSEHDQSADSPRPITPQMEERLGCEPWPRDELVQQQQRIDIPDKWGYKPMPLNRGYKPRPPKDSSSSNPPGDPPNQGPVGRKT